MPHASTRPSFLRAGAAALTAAALPRRAFAANATVKIGYIDSFSGPFADIGPRHRAGIELALKEANAKGSVRYELIAADDKGKPADASTELRRLLEQEKIDVLIQGTSSGVALALMPLALQAGVFQLSLNPNDTSITGKNASKNTFRFAPTSRMIIPAISQRVLAVGKKWYFFVADYAFGHDAYNRLSEALRRAGGTEAGHDDFPIGTRDQSPNMTKVRASDADVVMICAGGADVANICKTFVDFGLQKKMHIAGVSIEDTYSDVLPVDQLAGSTFGVLWSPSVSDGAKALASKLRKAIPGPLTQRYWLGYVNTLQLLDRLNAAGTTKCDALAKAFDDHRFNPGTPGVAQWRACDHQCAVDTFAGSILSRSRAAKLGYPIEVVSTVPGSSALGSCSETDAVAAVANMAKQTIGDRPAIALR